MADKQDTWSELWREFLQNTSIHGGRYIVVDGRFRLLRRGIWLIVVLVALAAFTYIATNRVVYYYTYPRSVNVEVVVETELEFPVLTLCNQNFVRKSKAYNAHIYDALVEEYTKLSNNEVEHEDHQTEDDCDVFNLYPNIHVRREGQNYIDYYGVTVTVCHSLCLAGAGLSCGSILYYYDERLCRLSPFSSSSTDMVMTPEDGLDYYERIRCQSPTLTCSFDSDICGFDISDTSGSLWTHMFGPSSITTALTGPTSDHTSGQGRYLLAEPGEGTQAILTSVAVIPGEAGRCVEFYYHMYGADIGRLNVYLKDEEEILHLVWSRTGDHGDRWRRGFVNAGTKNFLVVFEATGSKYQRRSIAIDDVYIASCQLTARDCLREPTGEGYMGTEYVVTQNGEECAQWQTVAQNIPLNPFHFVDSSLEAARNYCRNPGGLAETPWCYTSSSGDSWDYCDIPNCACRNDQFDCGNGKCVGMGCLCDGFNDCGNSLDERSECVAAINCSFEDQYQCGYVVQTPGSSGFRWTLRQGATSSTGTGPLVDRTTLTTQGQYAYTDASIGNLMDYTDLISPYRPYNGSACLSFYTHMYGRDVGTFEVFVEDITGERERLFFIQGGQGDEWRQVILQIGHDHWNLHDQIRLIFRVRRGSGHEGDIALDEVSLIDSQCSPLNYSTAEFLCDNNQIVPTSLLCNGEDDCGDRSDELEPCASLVCDFSSPALCGYTIEDSGGFAWERVEGEDTSLLEDNELETTTEIGMHMEARADGTVLPETQTSLMSPWLRVKVTSCLSFMYYHYTRGAADTQVSVCYKNESCFEAYGISSDHFDIWHKRYITLQGSDAVMQLKFTVTAGTYGRYFSLDNVELHEGGCELSFESINCTFDTPYACGYLTYIYGSEVVWSFRTGEDIQDRISDMPDFWDSDLVFAVNPSPMTSFPQRAAYAFSPWVDISPGVCLQFQLFPVIPSRNTLGVLLERSDGFLLPQYNVTPAEDKMWHQVNLRLPEGHWRVMFAGFRARMRASLITIDNVILSDAVCPPACSAGEYECGNGHCIGTRAVCDGQDDCGDYSDEKMCDQSCLRSPLGVEYHGTVNVTRSGRSCLAWADVSLVMYGPGKPLVFLDDSVQDASNYCRNPDGRTGGPWCMVSGDHSDGEWEFCDVPRCPCGSNQFQCGTSLCIGESALCDTVDDCGDRSDETSSFCNASISCNFDDQYVCGYELFPAASGFTFQRNHRRTPSGSTGPSDDHTHGNPDGYYMYTEASDLFDGDIARMRSQPELLEETHCLSFWVSMYGINIKYIKVFLWRPDIGLKELGSVWWNRGTSAWFELTYEIPAGELGVAFESNRGWKAYSDHALDDVLITPGVCTNSTCYNGDYSCGNGECVDQARLCDGVAECGNAADEVEACSHDCKRSSMGEFYRGSISLSSSGASCLPWESFLNHSTWTWQFPDDSIEELGSSCRNPDRTPLGPWCFIDSDGGWEYCDIATCPGVPQCDPAKDFACLNGACVAREVECDGVDDCGDNSDETEPCDGRRRLPPYEVCRSSVGGSEYIGSINVTADGEPCLLWTEAASSNLTDEEQILLPYYTSDMENYCRNPQDFRDMPWCYVNGASGITWQFCDIPICDCTITTTGEEYVGNENTTRTGLTCQRWDSQVPNAHFYTIATDFPDGTTDNNFCRNPGNDYTYTFCYTLARHRRWDFCDLPNCYEYTISVTLPECRMTNIGRDYRGTKNVSKTGLPCDYWANHEESEFVDGTAVDAQNFCRIPVGDSSDYGLWCYVQHEDIEWEPCDIPLCEGSMGTLDMSCGFDDLYSCGYKWDTAGTTHWKRLGTPYSKFGLEFLAVLIDGTDQCYQSETLGVDYMGHVSVSADGITCNRWDSMYPRAHSYVFFPDGNQTSAGNKCRNPSGAASPWCYSSLSTGETRLDCDIPTCVDTVMVVPPGGEEGDQTTLMSPVYPVSQPTDICVSFRYLLPGTGSGELQLDIAYVGGLVEPFWSVFGDEGIQWKIVALDLTNVTVPFQLQFTNRQGIGTIAVALDDINIQTMACSQNIVCGDGQFTCNNGLCINANRICDGISDCDDLSDELNCTCGPEEFRCAFGNCIGLSKVLDGVTDCPDHSDEMVGVNRAALLPPSYDGEAEMVVSSSNTLLEDLAPYLTLDHDHPVIEALNGDALFEFFLDAAHEGDDIIFSCNWRNTTCSPSYFTKRMLDYGVCYTFTLPDEELLVDETGAGSALTVIMNIESYEYMKGPYSEAGVKMFLHDPRSLPLVSDLGFALAPGFHYLLDIQPTENEQLEPPHGDCGENELQFFHFYELATCERECEIYATMDMCGCIAPYMIHARIANDSFQYCDFHEYFDCFLVNEGILQTLSHNCGCKDECASALYKPQLSLAALTEDMVHSIIQYGGETLDSKLRTAFDASDRSSEDFATDLAVIEAIVNAAASIDLVVTSIISETEPGGSYSILDVIKHSLYGYLDIVQSDFDFILSSLNTDYGISTMNIHHANFSYEKYRNELRQVAPYVLQYSIQMGVSLDVALARNEVDLLTPLKRFNESFSALVAQTINSENRVSYDFSAEPMPRFVYSSSEIREACTFEINAAMQAIDNVMTLLQGNGSVYYTYNDFDQITSVSANCFGDYFGVAEEVLNLLNDHTPYRHDNQIDAMVAELSGIRIREILTPITQLRQDTEYKMKQYTENEITKLQLAESLLSGSLDNMDAQLTVLLDHVSSDIFGTLKSTKAYIQSQLIQDYQSFFSAIEMLLPFYENVKFYSICSNLLLWYRPILQISGANVELSKTRDAQSIYQHVSTEQVLPVDYAIIIEESVQAAFEELDLLISTQENDFNEIAGVMVDQTNELRMMLQPLIAAAQLDVDMVKKNFISADVYFSRISKELVFEVEAYPFESLMGDIGGYLGLLLGGTVITVIEILDFLLYNTMYKIMEGRQLKTKKTRDDRNGDSTLDYHQKPFTMDVDIGTNNKAFEAESARL